MFGGHGLPGRDTSTHWGVSVPLVWPRRRPSPHVVWASALCADSGGLPPPLGPPAGGGGCFVLMIQDDLLRPAGGKCWRGDNTPHPPAGQPGFSTMGVPRLPEQEEGAGSDARALVRSLRASLRWLSRWSQQAGRPGPDSGSGETDSSPDGESSPLIFRREMLPKWEERPASLASH